MLTVEIAAHFAQGYIGHPYWPEMARLVDIQKQSGMNRAKSSANRRKALEEHLRSIGMTLVQYEALEKKAAEPFYRDSDGLIIIPELHVVSFLVATCDQARAASRPCEPHQVRSRFVCSPWTTGKEQPDGNFERFVTVTSGTGQKLSNQRGFRSNPYIAAFEAHGTISFDAKFVNPDTLKRALEFGGMFVGVGASRPMGWGRFELKKFAFNKQSSSSPTPSPTPSS
jgi:hypothetical protein